MLIGKAVGTQIRCHSRICQLGRLLVVDVGRGSIWSDGKGCAVGAFPSRMTVGILIDGA